MSSLFSKPDVPKPIAPPTVDEAAKARDAADQLARRKGRLSTVFAGASAGTSTGGGAAKALLGG